jgi:molybdenum cofactor cytidylyltransferase
VTRALILAAGAGRRFGGPKQLALVGGRPLLAHVLDVAAPYDPLVVLGARADEIRARIDVGDHVVAEDWAEGQSASLRAGVAALADADRVIVLLADQPFITREAIEAVLALGGDAARASYHGDPGHPVVLGRAVLERVGELRGDAGARELLQDFQVRTVEATGLCDPTDIDTPDQLEAPAR